MIRQREDATARTRRTRPRKKKRAGSGTAIGRHDDTPAGNKSKHSCRDEMKVMRRGREGEGKKRVAKTEGEKNGGHSCGCWGGRGGVAKREGEERGVQRKWQTRAVTLEGEESGGVMRGEEEGGVRRVL